MKPASYINLTCESEGLVLKCVLNKACPIISQLAEGSEYILPIQKKSILAVPFPQVRHDVL